MGEGYEQQVVRALEEGDPAAVAALEGQREIAAGLSADDFSAVMMRRATLCRLWNVYLQESYPVVVVVVVPASAELPFAADLDRRSPETYVRIWKAQMPMIGIPFVGLPALFITTGQTRGGTPVGMQIVAGRYREDLCLAAAEDIEARSRSDMPVMPVG
ncbi:MAG: hypothetical protein EOP02_01070 [Proteobacteria bacterium]|nr:MAG: hypothetical protein EOP02_01070 [Pseudomonadota bacterium]